MYKAISHFNITVVIEISKESTTTSEVSTASMMQEATTGAASTTGNYVQH